jgi:lycopene beta-cyclase
MNAPKLTYDFIITGFGCAGMSLLHYLLNSRLKHASILVVDPSDKTVNDRTWCYWAEEPLEIHPKNTPIVYWENISIQLGKQEVKKQLGEVKYFHIKSSDFYTEIIKRVQAHSNVHFTNDAVCNIHENPTGQVAVSTSKNGTYFGKKVFNSIPDTRFFQSDSTTLKQVFVGWKVTTAQPCFDKSTAVMMNFLNDSNEKTDFFYLLPFSEREALIEYTVFTTEKLQYGDMEPKLRNYIEKNLGQKTYEVSFREEGTIPMTTRVSAGSGSPHITHLGTLAGCSKASTGYTFHTIQKHCKSLVEKLERAEQSGHAGWERKKRFAFYDNIILNIAKKWPGALPGVFFNLFESNAGTDILRFLNEESNFLNELKLLSRLKFSIFIKSLLHYEKH